MQPIAVWLVARPERAVFVLIATFLLPITQIFGSAILVLLVLSRGPARAVIVAGLGFAGILLLALVSRVTVPQLVLAALMIWLPGMVLALLLQRMRSLTLLLQTTVLVAVVAIAALYLVLGDPAAYWQDYLEQLISGWRNEGLEKESEIFVQLQPYAAQLTGIFVSVAWMLHVVAFLTGYAAYNSLPGQERSFGRFSELNFGRVLAIVLALISIVAMISDAIWLQNLAFVLFVIFWLQGLAMLHWLRGKGRLPGTVLVGVYILTVFLAPLLVTAVGVLGYTDAWFDYRPRIGTK